MLIQTLLEHYDALRVVTWVDREDSGGFFFSGTSVWCQLFRIQEGKKLCLWAEDWKEDSLMVFVVLLTPLLKGDLPFTPCSHHAAKLCDFSEQEVDTVPSGDYKSGDVCSGCLPGFRLSLTHIFCI